MLVIVPSCLRIARFVVFIKGKSILIIFDRNANLKYGNRHFWCGGYFTDTVERNENAIKQYIQNQLKDDYGYDHMII